ncbi:MAG TPA: hypothetical protein VMF32_18050, partial [Xanthobacteraceae bacterium]|nr:hypothetical protein [Xanthobacteraceae bacterium]
FALDFRDASAGNYSYFFWYGTFNYAITNYYAAQANLAPLHLLPDRSPQDGYVLVATYNPGLLTPEPWFRKFLKYVFAKADYIVIPEQLDGFMRMWPSATVAYRKDIAAALNSPEAPEYFVWGVVEENRSRILVLKKRATTRPDAGLEVFPKTWGTAQQAIGEEFRGAIVVKQKPLWPLDLEAAPELLYSYHHFNVVRLGSLYVGVAQDAGPMDIRSALGGALSVPAGKLIIEHDPARLKYKIDFCSANATAPKQPDHSGH